MNFVETTDGCAATKNRANCHISNSWYHEFKSINLHNWFLIASMLVIFVEFFCFLFAGSLFHFTFLYSFFPLRYSLHTFHYYSFMEWMKWIPALCPVNSLPTSTPVSVFNRNLDLAATFHQSRLNSSPKGSLYCQLFI